MVKNIIGILYILMIGCCLISCDYTDAHDENCKNKNNLCLWNCANAYPADQGHFFVCIEFCEDRYDECRYGISV